MNQQQPVKYQEHTKVVQNNCETGGILSRPFKKREGKLSNLQIFKIMLKTIST